jgi:outer membrane protein OmpA-like peptidoglycan-associated protein
MTAFAVESRIAVMMDRTSKMCGMSRRARLGAAWTLTAAAALLSAPAVYAQSALENSGFQVESFEPMPMQGNNILHTAKSDILPDLSPSAGVMFHYANGLMVAKDAQGNTLSKIIEHQAKAELWAGIGLFDILDIGLVLPVVIYQDGKDTTGIFGAANKDISGAGLSDLRVVPKIRLLNPDNAAGFGLAIAVPVALPVGDQGTFNSDGSVRAEPRLVADWRHSSGFAIALNGGWLLRPKREAQNIVSDDALRWSAGLEIPLGLPQLKLLGSVFGTVPFADDRSVSGLAQDIGENRANPMEALAAVQFMADSGLVAQLGGGMGLSTGVGSPAYRVLATIGYTPRNADPDEDGIMSSSDECPNDPEDLDGFRDEDGCPDLDNDEDGIMDADDQCINEAEDIDQFEDEDGCPDLDNDKDGIADVDDMCPLEPGVAAEKGCPSKDKDKDGVPDADDLCPDDPEDIDQFEDADGCPDLDNDKDGVMDADDLCPMEPEDRDGFEDNDGCPEAGVPDRDGDGIPDDKDVCPDKPETYNGNKDEDGCPDGKQTVIITETEVKITEAIFFDTGKDTIQKRSFKILDVVATVLSQNPQITLMLIEGHTDDVGDDNENLALSKRRARSVANYLTGKGINASRLNSEGYGESMPVIDVKGLKGRKLKDGRASNRRVTFKILQVNGNDVKPAEKVIIKEKSVIEGPAPK